MTASVEASSKTTTVGTVATVALIAKVVVVKMVEVAGIIADILFFSMSSRLNKGIFPTMFTGWSTNTPRHNQKIAPLNPAETKIQTKLIRRHDFIQTQCS